MYFSKILVLIALVFLKNLQFFFKNFHFCIFEIWNNSEFFNQHKAHKHYSIIHFNTYNYWFALKYIEICIVGLSMWHFLKQICIKKIFISCLKIKCLEFINEYITTRYIMFCKVFIWKLYARMIYCQDIGFSGCIGLAKMATESYF